MAFLPISHHIFSVSGRYSCKCGVASFYCPITHFTVLPHLPSPPGSNLLNSILQDFECCQVFAECYEIWLPACLWPFTIFAERGRWRGEGGGERESPPEHWAKIKTEAWKLPKMKAAIYRSPPRCSAVVWIGNPSSQLWQIGPGANQNSLGAHFK